jgi:hypothetical protein
MLPVKRRLPPMKKKETILEMDLEKKEDEVLVQPENVNQNNNQMPDYLRLAENQHTLQTFMRMRQRNIQDGAIKINIEPDDLANENVDLYENKGINLEPPVLNEKLANNVEYHIQSVNKNRFFKLPKAGVERIEKKEKKKRAPAIAERAKEIPPEVNEKKALELLQIATEEEMFNKFDIQLRAHIKNLNNKITLLFLVAGGLLAGASLLNMLLLLQYLDYDQFINSYSYSAREIFNFIHAFTFCTLVGNGLKFLSNYKRCKFFNSDNMSMSAFDISSVYKLKRSMLFSGVIVFCILILNLVSTVIFAIMLSLSPYVPMINYQKYTSSELITQNQFSLFSTLFTVCNILAMIIFILNIFDLDLLRDDESESKGDEMSDDPK